MKVVQTRLSETQYSLLAAHAKAHDTTIKEAVREAIKKLTLRDDVDHDDPLFKAFPLTQKKSSIRDASEKADASLYGWER